MRYSSGHKITTRQRIVESAYRLFTARGYAATSIDEIMCDCGLTRGGFYAHFASKSQLYRHAIDYGASKGKLLGDTEGKDGDWMESLLNECLDFERGTRSSGAGRLAFLATDVASQESEVRFAYTQAFKSIGDKILRRTIAHISCGEESILSLTAMIVGAVAVAQTTDDIELRAKLLAACKANAKALLESEMQRRPLNFFWAPAMNS